MTNKDKTISLNVRNNLLLLAVIIISCIYFVINMPHDTVHILKTAFDDIIPRVPTFSVIYLTFLPWLWGGVLYSWYKNRAFKQLAYSLIVINLIAFCVYLFFQTYVPRDPITDHDVFSGLLQLIYSHDQPYNAFPSLHSALSAAVATYFVCIKSKWSWTAIVLGVLIVISTLFTKQHYVVDAISGVGLGIVVTWLVFQFKRKTDSF